MGKGFMPARLVSLRRFLKFLILFPFRLTLLIALLIAYLILCPIRGLFRKLALLLTDVLTMTYPFPPFHFTIMLPIEKWIKGMPQDLPIEKQAEPVYGWKVINVEYHRPFWELISQHDPSFIMTGIKDIAKCNGSHALITTPPYPPCSCGWYSYKSHRSIRDNFLWLAKCRYYGKVIECTEGYRAEKQDIVELWEPEDPNKSLNSQERSQLEEQFPAIKFHWSHNSRPSNLVTPDQVVPVQINFPGGDPYDIIAKEFFDYAQPNQVWFTPIYTKNVAAQMQVRAQVINNSLRIEFLDYTNAPMGTVHLTGTKYWWKEGK